MLLLGHTGITLGIARLGQLVARRSGPYRLSTTKDGDAARPGAKAVEVKPSAARHILQSVDYRLVMVGSLLPDLLDKPIGMILLADFFASGRIIAHTLAFGIVVLLAALYLYRQSRAKWPLALAFGTATHLVFDQMWREPRTLLWPLFGWDFTRSGVHLDNWLAFLFQVLRTKPDVYVPEIVGGAILIHFFAGILKRRKLGQFLLTGLRSDDRQ